MKRKTVTITGPASRLPKPLGEFVGSPEKPGPIRPRQVPQHRRLLAGAAVEITDGRKSIHLAPGEQAPA